MEKKVSLNKKRLNSTENGDNNKFKKEGGKFQAKKLKQMMKKRLIIRNLSFKVTEEKLKEIFSKFGEVLEANIPLNEAGRKRGFAFIRYSDTKSQIKAMKALNFKEIDGRPIAIDFAVPKTIYQSQNQNEKSLLNSLKADIKSEEDGSDLESDNSENEDIKPKITEPDSGNDHSDESEKEEDEKVKTFLKEFDAGEELNESSDESSEEDGGDEEDNDNDDDDDQSKHSDDITNTIDKMSKKKHSEDVAEGKTVFIRNVSFMNTEDDLQEIMQEYGEIQYCLLCMDPITSRPKGTAFVKFKENKSADKLIEESSKDPGILLDGRRLLCTYAVSREEISKTKNESPEVKDKRNLRLLKCGLILPDSKEAEGVSETDMTRRAQLEIVKKQKLKNTNFFVSDKRLLIHNLPKNITNKDLRFMFKKAAGEGAVLKEARVMRDFKKTDAQGMPVSRGFAFVSFTEHEHALKALMELNNNPKIFTSQTRPIVEFSVENKVALQSQEKRREKILLQNKRRIEEKLANNGNQAKEISQTPSQRMTLKGKGKRKNKHKNSPNKKIKHDVSSASPADKIQGTKSSKKKQKKQLRKKWNKKEGGLNSQDKGSLTVLANKYKKKLLNEYT